jgi:PAS domain S-box-containing protein
MPTPTTDPHPVSAPEMVAPGDWLFEHAPLPQTCAVVTPDGALSQWRGNAAWRRVFEGATPWVDPAVHAEFVHRLIARSGQEADGVEPLMREMALTDRQGRERQMLVKAHLWTMNGQTMLLSGYLDITRQRAAVMASIGEYREMVDSANDTILLVEHNRIIECNPAAEQLFGRSRADLIGQHPGDLSPPLQEGGIASMALAQQRMAEALSGVRRRFLWRHLRPDGSEFTAEVVLNPAHTVVQENGRPQHDRFVSVMRDVTDRLQAEQALKDSAERFRRLFELAPVPLALLEPRGRVLAVNRQWTQLLGYTLDEVPDIPTWVALAYPDEAYRNMALALWDQALTAVMDEGREMQPTEVQVRSKDGQMRSVLVGGAMVGKELMSSFVDVTPQRRAQAELEALNATLESRVQERTQALQSAVDHLQRTQEELVRAEKLAGLGSLVAGVAHELNTPIGNAVMVSSTLHDLQQQFEDSVAQGLKRSTLQQFQAHWREATEVIERNLQRAAELIASFKQVAVDQSSYQRRPFELREVLHELHLTLSPTLRRSQVELIDLAPAGLHMDSYPGPLTQVLMNLVNNAVVHAFDQREHLREVRITAEALPDRRVRLTVADNGCGVDPAHLSRLFDPFFTTKLGRGGSGLGLHIVYTLVTGLLGGSVQVSSPPGQGCTVTLDLPCEAPHTAASSDNMVQHG